MLLPGLKIRHLADYSKGERVVRYDPRTGQKSLVNPATGKAEPWPSAGWLLETKPQRCRVGTNTIKKGIAAGWIKLLGENIVLAPGGPPSDPNKVVHIFRQATAIQFRTVEGNVVYRVTHNPGKYTDGENGTRVDWFYDLELQTQPTA